MSMRRSYVTTLLLSLLLVWGPALKVDAADSFAGLTAAIQAANGGSRAITLGGNIVLTAPLPPITGSLAIDGGGHSISGNDAHRIFDVVGGALTLSNVTLTKGNAGESRGGAIRLRSGARAVIENATLSHNRAQSGGAISANGGTLHVVGATFDKNCAEWVSKLLNSGGQGAEREERGVDTDGCPLVTYHISSTGTVTADGDGGAILLLNGAQASVDGTTFSENRATYGGAIAANRGNVRLTVGRSSFHSNAVSIGGGALSADLATTRITRSSFVRNAADSGGGAIHVVTGALDISNSTFSENQSESGAGALAIDADANVTITHATFKDNWSLYRYGGAIENKGGGKVSLLNSLVESRGRSEDCVGGIDQSIGNLSTDGTCAPRTGDDPLLGDLSGWPAYYPLLDQSPAVDAAAEEHCLGSDQLGAPRPQRGGCDIGAIESSTAEAAPAPVVPPPACSLADQIIAANTDRQVGGCPAGNGADTIRFTRDILLFSRLPAIKSFITIEGNGHTISGNRQFRIFDVDGGHLTINNLTMTEGRSSSQSGGAIRLQNGGRAIVRDSSFIKNTADGGGAIAIQAIGSAFTGLTVSNSSFTGNGAGRTGGAIDLNFGTAVISGSSFLDNYAGQSGGAISLLNQPRLEVTNSTFIRNRASWDGDALAAENGARITLTHVTMTSGKPIKSYESRFGRANSISLRNSLIVNGAAAPDCDARLSQNVGNFIEDGSCSPMLSGDAMIAEASDGAAWLELKAESPAIGAADPRFCPDTDQLGRKRPIVGGCDIGAIESIPVRQTLSECQVTTTHMLNFRDEPSGSIIGGVPQNATVTAVTRTRRWFEVDYLGARGWISANYVVEAGDCNPN